MSDAPTIRVMALHALVYCERLFYLEEVEELRVADERVWAGRTLHAELDEPAEVVDLTLESAAHGIRGRVDAVRTRDGSLYPVEHKRGRSRQKTTGPDRAWDADRLQVTAYAMLLEEHLGRVVEEGRIRYHADNVTVRVPIDDAARSAVRDAVARANTLRISPDRPPITTDERKCLRCSLAPICLPEEARFVQEGGESRTPVRLFPADPPGRSLHVLTQGAKVGRASGALVVYERGEVPHEIGAREVSDVVLHGHSQITTQALRLCADEAIPVHLVTMSGAWLGSFSGPSGGVQRRVRQYRGLTDEAFALSLARRLIQAKIENQLRLVLRSSRGNEARRGLLGSAIDGIRQSLKGAAHAPSRDALMGFEGQAARSYFGALAHLVQAGEEMRPNGRSRRPPKDRFNALLSFLYALLHKDMMSAIVRVGLEPAFGVLHQPNSAAFPLALDLMELFRVCVADMAVLAAVNRRTFDPEADFSLVGEQVWLTETGRRKAIEAYERRKHEEYRHEVIGYSLSYARMMELEVRLLEKEWAGEPGLFARFRIR